MFDWGKLKRNINEVTRLPELKGGSDFTCSEYQTQWDEFSEKIKKYREELFSTIENDDRDEVDRDQFYEVWFNENSRDLVFWVFDRSEEAMFLYDARLWRTKFSMGETQSGMRFGLYKNGKIKFSFSDSNIDRNDVLNFKRSIVVTDRRIKNILIKIHLTQFNKN